MTTLREEIAADLENIEHGLAHARRGLSGGADVWIVAAQLAAQAEEIDAVRDRLMKISREALRMVLEDTP